MFKPEKRTLVGIKWKSCCFNSVMTERQRDSETERQREERERAIKRDKVTEKRERERESNIDRQTETESPRNMKKGSLLCISLPI